MHPKTISWMIPYILSRQVARRVPALKAILHVQHDTFVSSDPSDAAIYAMGEKIGLTPMKLQSSALFPEIYDTGKQSLYGKVLIKKEGCADFMHSVNQKSLSDGPNAKLDCGNNTPMQKYNTTPPKLPKEAEQRLEYIKELLDGGLITEEEAKIVRARIIDTL